MKEDKNNSFYESNNEIADVSKKLKSLPDIPLPSDFEIKLRNKIAASNQKKYRGVYYHNNVSKLLVYSGSLIAIIFIVIISFFVFNGTHNFGTVNSTVDSVDYQGKQVIIIPPTENQLEATGKKPLEKIASPKENKKSDKIIREYFQVDNEESTKKSEKAAPLNNILNPNKVEKGFRVDTIKKDTTNKNK